MKLFKITTPRHGITDVDVVDLINELKTRLRHAKEDAKHFNRKFDSYRIEADKEGGLWLSGVSVEDNNA